MSLIHFECSKAQSQLWGPHLANGLDFTTSSWESTSSQASVHISPLTSVHLRIYFSYILFFKICFNFFPSFFIFTTFLIFKCCLKIYAYFYDSLFRMKGFPGGSDVKETACSAGDPGWIPGLRRSPGEENGYPLQYSCPEHPMDRGASRATVRGVAKSETQLSD